MSAEWKETNLPNYQVIANRMEQGIKEDLWRGCSANEAGTGQQVV
jgi:hypothetical protein